MTGEQATGNPSYFDALMRGLQGAQEVAKTVNTPRQLSENYLATTLANRMNRPMAEGAQLAFDTDIDYKKAQTGLHHAQLEKYLNEIQTNKAFNDALSGGNQPGYTPNGFDNSGSNVSYEGPGPSKSSSAKDTFPGRFASAQPQPQQQPPQQHAIILQQGDPSKEYINNMYDTNPNFRKALEAKGYKKTTSVKVDQKTGASTVITQWPNGKIESTTTTPVNADKEYAELTSAAKSKALAGIIGIDNALPIIDELIELTKKRKVPGQYFGKYFSPNEQVSYESLVNQSGETLANALGYPTTDTGQARAVHSVARGNGERDDHYIERLESLKTELGKRKERNKNTLDTGVSITVAGQKTADPYNLGI
jgi:hypothetical protein